MRWERTSLHISNGIANKTETRKSTWNTQHPNTPHPFYMKGVNCIEQHKKPKEESPIQIRRNKLRTWFKYTISVPHTRARERTWTVTKNGSNKKHIFTLTALAKVISMLCWQWFENVRHTFFSNILHQPKGICIDLLTTPAFIQIFSCIYCNC